MAFVTVSLIVYFLVPKRFQWWVLLIDSLVFYFANSVAYTFAYLALSVASVYLATLYFDKKTKGKKPVLILTIVLNVGMLAVLKYTNLVINTINFFGQRKGIAPIGTVQWYSSLAISFYTLQIVAYLLDCYWQVTKRETNPLKLLLFTGYFPLMISGPISSHSDLGVKLFEEHDFDYARVASGFRRIAWGVAKKVIVADRLAVVVGFLFADPDTYSGLWVLIAALMFIVQLYFDFSGCMDIVLGVSKCFGIELTENFKAPFLSKSMQEFWQRWHITLGAWLKSYVMYPLLKTEGLSNLGARLKKKFGKQGKKIPSYIAMLAVWFLMGLWHGNSWKYVIGEGLWFWFVIVMEQILEPSFAKLEKSMHISKDAGWLNALRVARTVLLYSFGMIFFNAESLEAALHMIGRMFSWSGPQGFISALKTLYDEAFGAFGGIDALIVVVIMMGLQVFVDTRTYKDCDTQGLITKRPAAVRWMLYFALVLAIVLEGAFGQSSFIYFGF